MTREVFITDVFSEGPYAGNQLATMPDASGISTAEMQQIAKAFNFSETTFITGGSLERGFDVRIFTPNSELPFAGHPTLGTSYLIRNEILKSDVRELTLNLGVGPIPVTFADDGILWMTQTQPVFGASFNPADVAAELGLEPPDIDARFPCRNVSTGLEFLLVPLVSYSALKNAYVGQGQLAQAYFLFCAGGTTQHKGSRRGCLQKNWRSRKIRQPAVLTVAWRRTLLSTSILALARLMFV